MQGPSYFSLISLFILPVFLTWACYRLMSYRVPEYRRTWVNYCYWLLSVASIAVLILSRWLRISDTPQGAWLSFLMYTAYTWLAALLLMLILLLLLTTFEWLRKHLRSQPEISSETADEKLTRRDFLQRGLVFLPAVTFGLSANTIYQTQSTLVINRLTFTYPQLPISANGLTIAQISDTHIGPFFNLDRLDKVFTTVAANKPDIVAITGDLIDDLNLLPDVMERLIRFYREIPQGVYFCWGNHEYFRDINRVRAALAGTPITVLENSAEKIVDGDQPLYFAGVDYPWAKNKSDQGSIRRKMIDKAYSHVPSNAFSVLLTHHPDFIEDAFARKIPLTMAGHTHGGQISLFGRSILPVQYRYMRGLYQQAGLYGYVNSGTGHWLPVRIGCPAEVTLYTLRKGD